MSKKAIVTIIHDDNGYDKSFIELVKRYHDIKLVSVHSLTAEDFKLSLLIIIQVNLAEPTTLRPLKIKMQMPERAHVPVLFLLNEFSRHAVVQANMLGATDYIAYPCPNDYFINILGDLVSRTVEKAWEKLSHTQEMALKVSLKVLEDAFENALNGKEISQKELKDCCDLIIEATEKDGLTDWMNAIRQHHNYTYRHSMMVCGYLIAFGMYLGVKKTDLQALSLGDILHDIGKSLTPLEILDKPGQLTDSEWEIMRKHPGNSRIILKEGGWDKNMIDIAVHHHEKLDGGGYPDGLKGNEISDLARMTSIADIFSGITDKRSYKPAMPAEKALDIMLGMEGHLDIPLVKTFQTVILADEGNNSVHKTPLLIN